MKIMSSTAIPEAGEVEAWRTVRDEYAIETHIDPDRRFVYFVVGWSNNRDCRVALMADVAEQLGRDLTEAVERAAVTNAQVSADAITPDYREEQRGG